MIALDITARNYEVDDKLAHYVSDKINALEKYLPRQLKGTATGSVVFTDDTNGHENNRFVCEVILNVNGDKLMSKDELNRVWVLRKFMADMTATEAMEFLKDRIKGTKDNEEFLISMNG